MWTEHEMQSKQREHVKVFLKFYIVKITRFYDYQTWLTYLFEKFMRCTKVCGLFLDCAFRVLIGWIHIFILVPNVFSLPRPGTRQRGNEEVSFLPGLSYSVGFPKELQIFCLTLSYVYGPLLAKSFFPTNRLACGHYPSDSQWLLEQCSARPGECTCFSWKERRKRYFLIEIIIAYNINARWASQEDQQWKEPQGDFYKWSSNWGLL